MAMMTPRQQAAMGLTRGKPRKFDDGSGTPWSSILGTLGTIGGAIASPFTGGASLAAGPALAGVGAGIEAAEEGDEMGALSGLADAGGAVGGAYSGWEKKQKALEMQNRFADRLRALGVKQ